MKKSIKLFSSLAFTCCLISVTSTATFASPLKSDSSASKTSNGVITSYSGNNTDNFPKDINANTNVKYSSGFNTYTYANAPESARKQYEEDCKAVGKKPNPSDTILVKSNSTINNSMNTMLANSITPSDFMEFWVYTTNKTDYIEAHNNWNGATYIAHVYSDYVGYNHITQGSPVYVAQFLLINHGYNLTVDGIFGPQTQNALQDFQSKHNLSIDCIIGINTWTSLYNN